MHLTQLSSRTIAMGGLLAVLSTTAVWQDRQNTADRQVAGPTDVRHYGARGDGTTDDTAAIQRAVDSGAGNLTFPSGRYRITKPIEVDLAKTGFAALTGDLTATIHMHGAGPAFRIRGNHAGTADPGSVKDPVWSKERAPLVEGLEIVGEHPKACGIEASGCMQLVLQKLVIRKTLHAIHLVKRNRNVIVGDCQIYENSGAGIYYDHVNLHQSNITGSHISYNGQGGVVIRGGDVRNVQIGSCDIEGNMAADGPPAANIWLDSTGGSIGEVAIVGCTIQHDHKAPNSANIRIQNLSVARRHTNERRHGHVAISANVISDAQINIDIRDARGVSITGNTLWKGYRHNVQLVNCSGLVFSGNVMDRNPRYHYGDGDQARDGLILRNCTDCLLTGNMLQGTGDVEAAIDLDHCRRVQVADCSVLQFPKFGVRLSNCDQCPVTSCLFGKPEQGQINVQRVP